MSGSRESGVDGAESHACEEPRANKRSEQGSGRICPRAADGSPQSGPGTPGHRRCAEGRKGHDMRPTIRLGRVRGIAIGVHWSLLVIGFLIASTLAGSLLPRPRARRGRLLLGRGDPGHRALLRARSSPTSSRTHSSRCGGASGSRASRCGSSAASPASATKHPTPRSEFLVAAAGPATSIGLGVAFTAAASG